MDGDRDIRNGYFWYGILICLLFVNLELAPCKPAELLRFFGLQLDFGFRKCQIIPLWSLNLI